MEVVRLFDLRTKNGVGIMDMDDDPLGLKNALFYLDKKTGCSFLPRQENWKNDR